MFEKHGILNSAEIHSRYEIQLENYVKTIRIEASTMVEMINRQILPASIRYMKEVADTVNSLNVANVDSSGVKGDLDKLVMLTKSLRNKTDELSHKIQQLDENNSEILARAIFCKDAIVPLMEELRSYADRLECSVDASFWPIPTYTDLMFGLI